MANVASLPIMLKSLRLACINTHWQALAKKATTEGWMPEHYLAELCAMELATREDKRLQRYHKESNLPPGKMLSSFEFSALSGVSLQQVTALIQNPTWIEQGKSPPSTV